jgi:hypothetical protein
MLVLFPKCAFVALFLNGEGVGVGVVAVVSATDDEPVWLLLDASGCFWMLLGDSGLGLLSKSEPTGIIFLRPVGVCCGKRNTRIS